MNEQTPSVESMIASTVATDIQKPRLPSGDAAAQAIARVPAAPTVADLTSDRLVQQVGIALTDVHGSVTRRLDEIQQKIDAIRASLQAENAAARGRIERFVRLATDAAEATHGIDEALEKLNDAIG